MRSASMTEIGDGALAGGEDRNSMGFEETGDGVLVGGDPIGQSYDHQ